MASTSASTQQMHRTTLRRLNHDNVINASARKWDVYSYSAVSHPLTSVLNQLKAICENSRELRCIMPAVDGLIVAGKHRIAKHIFMLSKFIRKHHEQFNVKDTHMLAIGKALDLSISNDIDAAYSILQDSGIETQWSQYYKKQHVASKEPGC